MDRRLRDFDTSGSQQSEYCKEQRPMGETPTYLPAPQRWNTALRPLSDIRELTEPSLVDGAAKRRSNGQLRPRPSTSGTSCLRQPSSVKRPDSARTMRGPSSGKIALSNQHENASSSSYSPSPQPSSFYLIPPSSVPRRSSSHGHPRQTSKGSTDLSHMRRPRSVEKTADRAFVVPNRGQSRSPVKDACLRLDPISSDIARRVPSRTLIRSPHPADILKFPSFKHPRVKLELQVTAPLFVGGGSLEGFVKLTADDHERLKHRRSLGIGSIAVDLLGNEEVSGNRRASFLALGTDLIDEHHPPPANMIEPPNPLSANDGFWTLKPSTSALPFMISLPLDTGPPPFRSKPASIRFILCATALINDTNKLYRVRTSQEVQVLPTYDPEKALSSLPTPLTASDELPMPRAGGYESLKVTAGLHRQVWVSGSSIFADVHIANKSRQPVKRLDLSLERDILCYKHAPARTGERGAGQARIFENNHQSVIASSTFRSGLHGWSGVEPHGSETRTCELQLPRGLATVKCGKFFEVRYFLNVTAALSTTKLVSVQLPIILIHMNSLDAVPNSVAQVAAAVEEKRSARRRHRSIELDHRGRNRSRSRSVSPAKQGKEPKRKPSYSQGRAFAAPRQQSLDQLRAERQELEDIRRTLDSSPRKHQPYLQGFALKTVGRNFSTGSVNLKDKSVRGESPFPVVPHPTPTAPPRDHTTGKSSSPESSDGLRARVQRMRSFESFYSKQSARPRRRRPPRPATPGHRDAPNPEPFVRHVRSEKSIAPHALGLVVDTREAAADTLLRPSTSFRARGTVDPSRFEVKGVRRKASSSIRERGMNWWEQVRNSGKEKEGWI